MIQTKENFESPIYFMILVYGIAWKNIHKRIEMDASKSLRRCDHDLSDIGYPWMFERI